MKFDFEHIVIEHGPSGIITDVRGDGESLLGLHICNIKYEAAGPGPGFLEMTLKIIPPRITIKALPEENIAVSFDEPNV